MSRTTRRAAGSISSENIFEESAELWIDSTCQLISHVAKTTNFFAQPPRYSTRLSMPDFDGVVSFRTS